MAEERSIKAVHENKPQQMNASPFSQREKEARLRWPLVPTFDGSEASYLVVFAADASALEKLHEVTVQSSELSAFLYRASDGTVETSCIGAIMQPAMSRREAEVAKLLCLRLSNKEIGRALGLSHLTVRNYVSQLLRKLNVPSRQAVITLLGQFQDVEDGQAIP